MKERKQHIFIFSVVTLFFVVLIAGSNVYRGERLGFYGGKIYTMNQGWTYGEADHDDTEITLPVKLPVEVNHEYSISAYLPTDFPEGMSMMLRTSQQSIRVTVDGEEIFSRGQDSSLYPGTFRGSSWSLFFVSQEYAGKKITITLVSPYESFSGKITDIYCGYKSDLMYHIFFTKMPEFIAAWIMFIIGIGMLIFSIFKWRAGAEELDTLYLALFAIFCSFYLFGESKMLQFIVSNQFFISALPFLAETMIAIPLVMYLRDQWLPQHRWVAQVLQWIFLLDFLVITGMQFLGMGDFFETIIIFHITVYLFIIATGSVTVIEIVKYKNRRVYVLAYALGIICIAAVIGMVQLYLGIFEKVGFSMQMGMLGFEIVMATYSIQSFYEVEENLREKRYYERLAYIDALTLGKNRNAYTERIVELEKSYNKNNKEKRRVGKNAKNKTARLYYLLADLNNLKIINDTYGHAVGDDAILRAYKYLTSAFAKHGECFRIGGDEFVVLLEQCNEQEFETCMRQLSLESEMNNLEIDYELGIATGYSFYEPGDEPLDFEKLMKQADKMLYENKHIMKLKDLITSY